MNKKISIAIILVLFIALVAIFKQERKETVLNVKNNLTNLIEENGSKEAYSMLKNKYANSNPSEAHTNIHLFGEQLFKKDGITGILVCDNSFGFACYHGVYIAAIQKSGDEVLGQLEDICLKVAEYDLNCTHGIGHGILEYVGHTNLEKALDICSTLKTPGNRFGCKTGVYMEFNFPTLSQPDGTKLLSKRDFNEEDIEQPCTTVSLKHQRICYYGLGQYWAQIFPDDYGKVGKLCGTIRDENFRFACFFGVGTTIPLATDSRLEKILGACNKTQSVQDHDFCIQGIRWGLGPTNEDLSNELCSHFINQGSRKCKDLFMVYMEEEK